MSTRCIGCKREIEKKQKSCYICGSSQNYLSYYSNHIIALLTVIIGAGWISSKIIETKVEDFQNAQLLNNQESITKFDKIQLDLNKQILSLENSRNSAQSEIEELKASILAGSSSSSETLITLEKEQARSKWLGKENRKFSSKIKDLTNHIAKLEQQISLTEKKPEVELSTNSPELSQEIKEARNIVSEENQPVIEDSDNGI